ncbi:SGNH/GDSL hydrolase family protein [Nocardioides sp. LML1-1-1.1]|uniref:SGNH/GDSL hydrolase family protein n=1 Tax=Nocardioides sp. LML1-1-1.1 TaxID=3135248 RepID=UPI00343306CE
MTRHRLVLAALVVLLAATVTGTIWARAGARTDHCGLTAERADARAALVTGRGPEVLVVGDSYSVGAGLPYADSWPTRLPGRVRVDGFSGSGFSVGASACGDRSYATRLPRSLRPGTRLVVVEGGLNDFDQPVADVEAGYRRLLAALGGTPALVVGPPVVPHRPDGTGVAVDAALARLTAESGTPYLSMVGVDLSLLDDGVHPDAAGQRAFGDVVAAKVEELLGAATGDTRRRP